MASSSDSSFESEGGADKPTPAPRLTCCSPVTWLLVSIVVGVTLGALLSHAGLGNSPGVVILSLPGQLWLKSLKCIVLPMIIFSMVEAMVMLRSLPGARRVGFAVIGLYLMTTVTAAVEGCIFAAAILGPNVKPMIGPANAEKPSLKERTLLETVCGMIDNIVPKNLVGDAASNNLLPVIVASIIFGLVVQIKQADGTDSLALRLMRELNQVVVKVITGILTLTPIGVGSLVLRSAARFNLAEVGSNVGLLIVAGTTGLLFHGLVFYPTLMLLLACRNPIRYFSNIGTALAVAVGTSSSAATLPASINCAIMNNGIAPHIANFVLSLGATINMDGTSLYLICATYFLGTLQGVAFGVDKFILVALLATLCSMGSAPVPSASLVLLATILTTVDVPLNETLGLITAVDWMLDRLRTCVNIAGDACVAGIVDARFSPSHLKMEALEVCEAGQA